MDLKDLVRFQHFSGTKQQREKYYTGAVILDPIRHCDINEDFVTAYIPLHGLIERAELSFGGDSYPVLFRRVEPVLETTPSDSNRKSKKTRNNQTYTTSRRKAGKFKRDSR